MSFGVPRAIVNDSQVKADKNLDEDDDHDWSQKTTTTSSEAFRFMSCDKLVLQHYSTQKNLRKKSRGGLFSTTRLDRSLFGVLI